MSNAAETLERITGLKGNEAVAWLEGRAQAIEAMALADHYTGNVPRPAVGAFRRIAAARDALTEQCVLFRQAVQAQQVFEAAQQKRAEAKAKAEAEERKRREQELREQLVKSTRELVELTKEDDG
ncbi:MAG: hypothetical protein ACOCXM_03255 [Myxococcota bacterium]